MSLVSFVCEQKPMNIVQFFKDHTYSQLYLMSYAAKKLFDSVMGKDKDVVGANLNFDDMTGADYLRYLQTSGIDGMAVS